MRCERGFTLIELMITVAIVAILAAVGYPSYRDHIARGQRSQGQQFLSELAQRQEQFMLDRRRYAADRAELGLNLPEGFKYGDTPAFTVDAGPPPSYSVCIDPAAGSALAGRGDGSLCVNSLGERWRQAAGGDGRFDAASECAWENTSCTHLPR